uniref:Uncharacterized protein n=1 Tax=Acrobeloides nanus TaxID=290746 RepID=A0A914DZ57_9BILA
MQRSVSNVKEIRDERLVKYYNVLWPVAELGKWKFRSHKTCGMIPTQMSIHQEKELDCMLEENTRIPTNFASDFTLLPLYRSFTKILANFLFRVMQQIDRLTRHKLLLALRFFATGHFYYSVVRFGIIILMISFFGGCSSSSE